MIYKEIESVADEKVQENGVINILLIGNDSREDGEDGRSDAMILVSVSSKTGKILFTSLLRDIYVSIPGHDDNRLNAAYSIGGPELLMQTVEENFDIPVNRYVLVNFDAFAGVVDAVGGVDLDLTNDEVKWVNAYLKDMIVNDILLKSLYVKGEASNVKYHSSGHLYFTLKDRNSIIQCAMFSGYQKKGLHFRLKDGDEVIVGCSVDLYEKGGSYKLKVMEIYQAGAGRINEAFEKFLDQFFQSTAWDVSSDISVMNQMMAQDGLTGGNDFARAAAAAKAASEAQVQQAAQEAAQQTTQQAAQHTGGVKVQTMGGVQALVQEEEQ